MGHICPSCITFKLFWLLLENAIMPANIKVKREKITVKGGAEFRGGITAGDSVTGNITLKEKEVEVDSTSKYDSRIDAGTSGVQERAENSVRVKSALVVTLNVESAYVVNEEVVAEGAKGSEKMIKE